MQNGCLAHAKSSDCRGVQSRTSHGQPDNILIAEGYGRAKTTAKPLPRPTRKGTSYRQVLPTTRVLPHNTYIYIYIYTYIIYIYLYYTSLSLSLSLYIYIYIYIIPKAHRGDDRARGGAGQAQRPEGGAPLGRRDRTTIHTNNDNNINHTTATTTTTTATTTTTTTTNNNNDNHN